MPHALYIYCHAHRLNLVLFDEKLKKLHSQSNLSDTCWACQHAALVAIRKSLPAVRETFMDIMCLSKTEARAVSGLIDGQFVLLLTLFEDLFWVMKFMSDQLQSPSLELSSTMDLTRQTCGGVVEGNSGQSNRPVHQSQV